jgi:TnpA family transposase
VTQLKRDPKDLSLGEIKREIERAANLCEIYQLSQKLLPELALPNQSIDYYASLVFYYSVYKLKRFSLRVVYLYLLCFAHQRFQKVNDNLINSLIYRLRLYTDQAKEEAREKLLSMRLETNQDIGKAPQILKLFTDQLIPPETPFGEVQQKAFKILSPEAINRVADHIIHEKKFDETELRWESLEKISHRIKLNLRPILTSVEFTASSTDAHLLEAIIFLRQIILTEKPFQQILSDKFPVSFIPENQRRYLYALDKKTKQKRIIPDRYEFLVYRLLRDALEAGEIYCRDSIRFRSFEDDLLDDKQWQHKELLIENANLPILKDSITTHLEFLKETLENQIEQVNRRIISAENKHLVFKNGNSQNRWVLEYPAKVDEVNESFFDSIPQVNLNDVIRFVHWQTGFMDSFEHLLGRYVKKNLDETIIMACLMAWGTNIGLGKMGDISDLDFQTLKTTSENFIRPETLQTANDLVTNAITQFPLFRHYDINEMVHSSSDGQKFETKLPTFNARHSPKYFGLQKGVVAYTLVANHIPVNARIIGANEHESHYVFDLLFNNITNVQPEIHSTDTHGTNQVNFALLHLFGYQFAPRYKDICDTVTKSLYGFRHPNHYSDLPLKPIRKINTRLIISEWENIQRIILSLAMKETTQYIITAKLSSYARKNKTKRALWEYDNIIKSLYLLDFIDSPPLRRNVQQALNRGENYHQLKRAISYANFGKLRYKSEYEQNIWNECSRLLTNCILYYNISILSQAIKRREEINATEEILYLKQISPTAWQHINFLGRYEFGKLDNLINIDEIVDKLKPHQTKFGKIIAS